MEENNKKNADEIKIIHSDISVSVNSKDGQRKEYVFPESLPSDVIAISSVASTAADMGIQVLKPWQDKITDEIDDIKNFQMDEVEVNFGIVKFKFKRKK